MTQFEYKVIPAPRRGKKASGVKTPEARFALALETLMNAEGSDGWEYLRAETLPCDERSGLTSTVMHYRNVLVFRRAIAQSVPTEVSTDVSASLTEVPRTTMASVAPADTAEVAVGQNSDEDTNTDEKAETDNVTPLHS